MRAIPPGLAARLSEGATSLCHCWSLTRRDGFSLGFTDHDRDIAFGGLVYAARTGLEAAEASAELGFAVGGGDVAGAALWSKCTKGGAMTPYFKGSSRPLSSKGSLLECGHSFARALAASSGLSGLGLPSHGSLWIGPEGLLFSKTLKLLEESYPR